MFSFAPAVGPNFDAARHRIAELNLAINPRTRRTIVEWRVIRRVGSLAEKFFRKFVKGFCCLPKVLAAARVRRSGEYEAPVIR